MSNLKKYLNERKETLESVAEYVNSEGLGYAIQSGLNWKDMEDKKLAKYWKIAENAMNEITNILGDSLEY
jgi:hypothetical protein